MSAFIDEHREVFGVEPICSVLQVAPSTYYAVKSARGRPAPRTLRDRELLAEIRRVLRRLAAACTGPGRSGGSCRPKASAWRAARSSG